MAPLLNEIVHHEFNNLLNPKIQEIADYNILSDDNQTDDNDDDETGVISNDEDCLKVYETVLNEITTTDHQINNDSDNNKIFKRVEYRCQAQSTSFGFIDHYYLVIDETEYHLGHYRKGNILPKGTTKGSHVAAIKDICKLCYTKLFTDLKLREDKRLISYFPFLNCETLSTGFSVQSLGFLSIPLILVLFIKGLFLYGIIAFLLTFVILLYYSKFIYSRTNYSKCKHLK